MCRLRNLSDVLQYHGHLLSITTRPELGSHQRLPNVRLTGHANRLAIQKCSGSASCRELLLQHRIVDDADFGLFVYEQRDRDTGMWKTVYEIHCSVDRIDDPGWCIGQLCRGACFAALLLTNKSFKNIGTEDDFIKLID